MKGHVHGYIRARNLLVDIGDVEHPKVMLRETHHLRPSSQQEPWARRTAPMRNWWVWAITCLNNALASAEVHVAWGSSGICMVLTLRCFKLCTFFQFAKSWHANVGVNKHSSMLNARPMIAVT
jgi:hypothetical protein